MLLAECRDGLGREDFLDWFTSADSTHLAGRLRDHYQVNGQTAWSLLSKAERFDVQIVTELDDTAVVLMRMKKAGQDALLLEEFQVRKGYIIPNGAKIRVTLAK